MTGRRMAAPEVAERWRVLGACGNNISEAARVLEMERRPLSKWYDRNKRPSKKVLPVFDDDLPVEELIKHAMARSTLRKAGAASKDWQPIFMKDNKPIVFAVVGDPHLDDDGCDWKALTDDVELLKRPGVYAVNAGDTTNNWTGRLMRLYANQSASVSDARKFAEWFLNSAGIRWLAWALGNHDTWEHGGEILKLLNRKKIVMEEWEVKAKLVFPNGFELPFWLAHSFKGHSQYNKSHGASRAAKERRGARIYARGHTHECHLMWDEIPDTGDTFWTCSASGYKKIDSHAKVHGFPSARNGATMAFVIDPRATDPAGQIMGFPLLATAVAVRDALAS